GWGCISAGCLRKIRRRERGGSAEVRGEKVTRVVAGRTIRREAPLNLPLRTSAQTSAPAASNLNHRPHAEMGRDGVTERIFDGLKVIDCASFIAGPAAATIMSDFGADVIKIEPPGMGDPYRRRGTPAPGRPALNPGFFFDARNKKSLALDLRTDAG